MSLSYQLIPFTTDAGPFAVHAVSGNGRYITVSSPAASLGGAQADNTVSARELYLLDMLEGTARLVTIGSQVVGNSSSWISADAGTVMVGLGAGFSGLPAGYVQVGSFGTWSAESGLFSALGVSSAALGGMASPVLVGSSPDMRYLVLTASTNGTAPLWLYDRASDSAVKIAGGNAIAISLGAMDPATVSLDGRYVFFSTATRLEAGDNNSYADLFRYDVQTGALKLVSHTAAGGYTSVSSPYVIPPPNIAPQITADGRYVVYSGAGAGISSSQVWLWDSLTDTNTLVSRPVGSGSLPQTTGSATISADGRFIAYVALAGDLIDGEAASYFRHAYLYDVLSGTTQRLDTRDLPTDTQFSFSQDGKWLVFRTDAALVAQDVNGAFDLYRVALTGADTAAPTLSITSSDAELTRGETATITFAFSELVGGFTLSDIAVAGGTLSNLWTSDNITWTARFTPTADWHGTGAFIVLGSAYHDLTGNSGISHGLNLSVATDTLGATPILTAITTDTGLAGDFITADGTLVLHGQAGAMRDVQVSLAGGGLLGTAFTDMDGHWSLDLTGAPFAPGRYVLHVTADDGTGGNVAAATDTVLLVTASEVAPDLLPDHGTTQSLGGGATLNLGGGSHLVILGGGGNSLTLGEGRSFVMSDHSGGTTVTAGNGGVGIELQGWNNTITTGSGDDEIWAGMGMSLISSGAGNDTIWLGASGASSVDAGAGDDIIHTGGALNDELRGGLGDDQYVVRSITTRIVENAGEGTDTAWVAVDDFAMPANVEIIRLIESAHSFTGGAGNDTIVANQAPGQGSVLNGGAGDDMLYGSAGDDVLTGGPGDDVLFSYGGMDRYVFGAGWGQDTIWGWQPGQKLDVSGLGLSFADVVQVGMGDMVRVLIGANGFDVHGTGAVSVGDFIF